MIAIVCALAPFAAGASAPPGAATPPESGVAPDAAGDEVPPIDTPPAAPNTDPEEGTDPESSDDVAREGPSEEAPNATAATAASGSSHAELGGELNEGGSDDALAEKSDAGQRERPMKMSIPRRFVGAKKTFLAKHRIAYSNLLAPRLNPLGVENRFFLGYEYRLYDTRGKLKDGAHVGLAFSPFLSPALTRLGGTLTIMPLAILRLQASAGWLQHFGTFQFVQSYDSPGADFSTSSLRANEKDRYAAGGVQAQLSALLQLKAGPIAIRSDTSFFYTNLFNLTKGDDLWYDIRLDLLSPNKGWTAVNDSDLLYVSKFGLTAGVRATTSRAFYPDSVYNASDVDDQASTKYPLATPVERGDDPNSHTVRVGPMLAYTFFDRPERGFNKPSIVLITQWWVKHRFRTGDDEIGGSLGDSKRAMPMIVLAFAFQGEVWSSPAAQGRKK